METAKVFWSGRSQAVRLPKTFRFDTDEVRSQAWRQLSWDRSRVIGIGFTRSSARSTTAL